MPPALLFIPPENIEHLFRPFFTTKEKGCGLGLAFCHKIIHSHGGHIRVESSPGVQTSMSIWLPEKKIASL
jgi:signal transduction histidine kinase